MANSSKSPMSRFNDRLSYILPILVLTTAVPLASARPSWWLLWTGVVALLTLVWLGQSLRLSSQRKLQSQSLKFLLALAALVPLYALVQSLPLPFLPLAMKEGAEALAGNSISVLPSASQLGAIRFAGWILLFFLVLETANSRERMMRMCRILFIGITLQAVWALAALRIFNDIALFGEKVYYSGSATGTFVNRNSLATYLGFGLLLGAGLLARRMGAPQMRLSRAPTIFERIGTGGVFILLAMVILLMALIASQSRMGIGASLIALWATSLVLLSKNNLLNRTILVISLIGFLVLLVIVLVLGQGGVSERFIFTLTNSEERLVIYQHVWQMITTRPLLGFGFDAFGPAFETFRTSGLNAPVYYDLAHNSYLALWAEMGLIIGSIPTLVLAAAAYLLVKRSKDGQGYPVASITALGALLLGALHSLVDFSLEIPANVFLFVTLLALGLAKQKKRGSQSGTAKT